MRKINNDFTSEEFIAKAFRRCGYWIEPFQEQYQRSHKFDLYAKKDDNRFAIEIKNYDYNRKLTKDFIYEMIDKIHGIDSDIRPLLIINSNYLDDDIKKELVRQNVLILDIKNIKKMQKGRDMVGEILRDQKYHNYN